MTSFRAIAEQYMEGLWNRKDLSVIDSLVDARVVIHSPLGTFHGALSMREIASAWLQAFPDLQVENELIVSEKDLVSVAWSARGTHNGDFKGRPASGKSVNYSGVTIYRFNDARIVEYWAYVDMYNLLKQLD